MSLQPQEVPPVPDETRRIARQTTSKFPFRWWGVNSALSGKHQLRRPSEPYSTEEEALDA
jgi:hypothetical protein